VKNNRRPVLTQAFTTYFCDRWYGEEQEKIKDEKSVELMPKFETVLSNPMMVRKEL
jgi:hypothetical protein